MLNILFAFLLVVKALRAVKFATISGAVLTETDN